MSALIVLAIVAAVVVILAARVAISMFKRAIRKHGGGHLVWYFVSGHHFGGERDCCARHCTRAVRWRRARRRLAPFGAILGTVLALLLHLGPRPMAAPVGLLAALVTLYPLRAGRVGRVVAGPAVAVVAKRVTVPAIPAPEWAHRAAVPVVRLAELAQHRRDVVAPLAIALAPVLEMPVKDARKAITVPAGWQKPGAELGLGVLPGWSATIERQKFIEREINQRLPGVEWGAAYHLGATPRRITFTPMPEPPRVVPLAEVLGAIEAARQGKPVIGIDSRGHLVYIDLDKETPHIGLSIGTGGGKSDWLKLLIMQLITKGVERIVIIDPKGGSQKWAEDEIGRVIVPGVEIHYDLDDQWQAIENFRNRMEKDYRSWRSDRRQRFAREVLIMEEQNDFAAESLAHWKKVRTRKDPTMPPPFDHTGRVLFKGRQANRNVISVYQRMSVQATGGLGDIRDQYGTKVMGRFSPSAWDSLVGTRPRGKSSTIPGRMISITGPDHQVVQTPWATDTEALDYVFSHGLSRIHHGPVTDVPLSLSRAQTLSSAGQNGQGQRDRDTGDTLTRPTLTLITNRRNLRQHADRGTVPMSYAALNKRRQRDPGFPAGVNKTYTDAEIRDWYEGAAAGASGRARREA